jgi:outer membrane receptor protein involved in Fe transport
VESGSKVDFRQSRCQKRIALGRRAAWLHTLCVGTDEFTRVEVVHPLGSETNYRQGESDYAGFGSLTWNITDKLRVTGGLRATWVDKNYYYNSLYGNAAQEYGGVSPFTSSL